MITTSFVTVAVLIGLAVKMGKVQVAGLVAGAVLGLTLMSTPAGPPLAKGLTSAATALGNGAVSAYHAVVDR